MIHRFLTFTLLCLPWFNLPAPASPNIIIFLADDLGYADVGANGHATDIATPHIDAIAANGVRFTDGYATHPYCSPSRAGLMSGIYQHRFGFETNSGPERYAAANFGVPRHIPILAEKLKGTGYATGMIGKWHIGFKEGLRPHERGFDSFYGFLSGARSFYPDPGGTSPLMRNGAVVEDEPAYLTDAFADEAIAFIERSAKEPWFLYLAFNAVHTPMEATEEYEARFPDIKEPKRRTLAGMLAAMDDAVGRVMEKVRALGEEENTLVFFYSDNGGIPPKNASRNGPLRGMKATMFEGGIRVPFLVQWKGRIPAGEVYEEPVMGFDVHATALAQSSRHAPRDETDLSRSERTTLDGVDLLPFLTGERDGHPHEALFWRAGNQHAIRFGDWKLVQTPREKPMLFNLERDLAEANDLATTNPEKLAQLQAQFAEWSGSMMEPQWIRQDRANAEPGGELKESPRRSKRNEGINRDTPGKASTPPPAPDPILSQTFADWFRERDADGDRRIKPGELDAKSIRGADRNADGEVSLSEGRRYFDDLQATLAARANPDIFEPWKKIENQSRLRRAKSGDPLLNFRFARDLPTGEEDPNGTLITGSECTHLETHRGMLFATLSGWNHDAKRAPWPGASVAVKRAADGPWEIEANFGKQTGRASSLASLAFTTDAGGVELDPAVPVLVAGVSGREDSGNVIVWARDDESGEWIKTIAGKHEGPVSPEVRVLFDHVDAVTGIHHVLAAASNGMLFRGAYDPGVPGRIRWNTEPELSGRERRTMAAAELDGSVYITIDLEPTEPKNGGLFRRIDGAEPRWEHVTGWKWSHPNPEHQRPWFGMRGLTALKDGTLIGAREHPGAIDRIVPAAPAGERVATEYDVRSALMDSWDFPPSVRGGMTIIAYNDMLPVTHPKTGDDTLLIPLGTRHPEGGRLRDTNALGASAWYLVRYGEGDYGLGRVSDPGRPLANRESGGLRATRTIRPSPFPEEEGRVWYFAGFDAFGGPSHLNTAWVYRGEIAGSGDVQGGDDPK